MTRHIISFILLLTLISCSDKFDKKMWVQNSNNNSDNPRYDMVDDLKKNYLKSGMTNHEIYQLLDKPMRIDTIKNNVQWAYPIGSNPGLHIDPYTLLINFDTNGKLVDLEIVKH